MENRSLKRSEWKSFFESIAKKTRGQSIEIEIVGSEFGDQIEEEWTPLSALSFDPNEGILYIAAGILEHSIVNPKELVIIEDGLNLKTVVIKDAANNLQLIHFKTPLELMRPESPSAQL